MASSSMSDSLEGLLMGGQSKRQPMMRSNGRRYYIVAIAAALFVGTLWIMTHSGFAASSGLGPRPLLTSVAVTCNSSDFIYAELYPTSRQAPAGEPGMRWVLTTSDETLGQSVLDSAMDPEVKQTTFFNTDAEGRLLINIAAENTYESGAKWNHRIQGMELVLKQPISSANDVAIVVIDDEHSDRPAGTYRCRTSLSESRLVITAKCGRDIISHEHGQYSGLLGRMVQIHSSTALEVESFDIHVPATSSYRALTAKLELGKKSPFPVPRSRSVIPKQFIWMYGLWDEAFRLDAVTNDRTGYGPTEMTREVLELLPQVYMSRLSQWMEVYNSKNGFKHFLWDKHRAERLLYTEYPEFIQVYETYDRLVMRADLLRYLLVYRYGGFYNDLDVRAEPGAPLEAFTKNEYGSGPMPSAIIWGEAAQNFGTVCREDTGCELVRPSAFSSRLSNFAFAAIPLHPVLTETLRLVYQRSLINPVENDDRVLYITGPAAVTDAAHFVLAELNSSSLNTKYSCDDLYLLQTTHYTTRSETALYLHHEPMGTWRNGLDHETANQ